MIVTVDKAPVRVLDHGYIRLIDALGTDESIIEAARMSTGKGFQGWDKDAKLLEHLWREQHTTPFEMCELVVEVQAPIFVFREWHRHRTQSYNEFSARYAQMPNVHTLPAPSRVQKQSKSNKQGSADPIPEADAVNIIEELQRQQESVYAMYDMLVKEDIAKEVARWNTPVSRYSRMRAKANLLNWFRFLKLRMAPDAQYEIRQYANVVGDLVKQLWPHSWALFEEYTLHGVSLSREEARIIRLAFQQGAGWIGDFPDRLKRKLGLEVA